MATIPCPNPCCRNGRVYSTKKDPTTGKDVTSSRTCTKCGGSGVVSTVEDR